MGVSWDDIQSGVLDTGKLVAETMALWNQATGKTPAAAATLVPAGGGSAVPTAQTQASASAGTGSRTMDIPQWLLAAGAVGLAYLLFRK